MNFRMQTEELGDSLAVVALTGEVDLYNAPQLKDELVRLIEGGATTIVVDLAETTFIDSTTLGVLIGGVKRLRPAGGRLELVVADPAVRKVFEITGLDRVFALHEARERAVAAARSG
jgi:anti-sigma B factor antagonist